MACAAQDTVGRAADAVPEETAYALAAQIRAANCPSCQGTGPVEYWRSYRCMSFLILTRWSTRVQVACASCAKKKVAGDLAFSLVLGWWGFPWGFIMTPVQVFRNLGELFRSAGPGRPTDELVLVARRLIASRAAANKSLPAAS